MAESENNKVITLKKGYVLSMGIVLLALGIVISSQTVKYIEAEKSRLPETRQIDQLVLLLKDSETKKADMEKQLDKLRKQMQTTDVKSLPSSLSSPQLQKLYQISGLTAVKGQGIEIKLQDSDNNVQNSKQDNSLITNDGLVHSEDILKIINELKSAGATAFSVNGQRIITTSEIVTAGTNIMVNQVRITAPYVIKAVGSADTMMSALKMRGGIAEYLEAFEIKIDIKKKDNITIVPYTGSL